jgi:CheY-like chemotaxis protein
MPVLFLTPLDGEEMQMALSRMRRTLSKPISCSTLYDAVMSLLFPHLIEQQSEKKDNIGDWQFNLLPDGQKIHILVAEDNKVNQIVVTEMLTHANLSSEVAQNGLEAFHCYTTGKYDLLLMDCQMPQVDGYGATEMIRKWETQNAKPRTPIIALTANAVSGDEQKCFDAGMDAYCCKPINPAILFQTMERLLGTGKE